MPITNNNIPVIDLPTWEVLQPHPAGSGGVGICCCTDPRGTHRYIYWLISATSFWRYDTYSNTWQQLASPPGGTVGAGTAMKFDPSRGTGGYIWALISNGTATPTWQYYDVAANTWTARSVTGLPSTFGTDASLAHTCSTRNPAGDDDFLYLIGNNATTFYRYSISGNSWTNTLTACTGATGAGSELTWEPDWDVDRLVRVRGGATNVIDYYSISGNTWTPIAYTPNTETFTTGSSAVSRGTGSGADIFIQKDGTNRIYKLDLANGLLIPQATEYLIAAGTAVVGTKMVYIKEANGIEFIYLTPTTSTAFLRTALYF